VSHSTSNDTKEQIRQSVDILDLVGSYIDLRRQGRLWVGLCPWHDDAKPSLQVNQERQSWKCWVCNIGGDVFSFVMQREGLEFRDALRMLADRAGIELTTASQGRPARPGSAEDKQTLFQAMAWAAQQYHDCLLKSADAAPARQYLDGRSITRDSIQKYQLGFAPNQWQWLSDRAKTTAFGAEVLEAVGLTGRSQRSGNFYDRFRGRVLFPIRDMQNRTIAMGGRILPQWQDDKSAKYINSPETRLFSKSEHLYGLDTIRNSVARDRHVVVVEGYTDAVMAWQHGLDNVAAVLGTALGARHIRLLRGLADVITLVLDGDEAGQKRSNEILELFIANQVDLRIATLPDGLDPCDFLLTRGREAFGQFVSDAADALEHKVRITTQGFDPLRDTHRANAALQALLEMLAKAPRLQSDTTSPIRLRHEQILARLARQFGVDESGLRTQLTALRRKAARSTARDPSPAEGDSVEPLDPIARELLELLTQHPGLVPDAARAIAIDELPSSLGREIYAKFVALDAENAPPDFGRVLTELEQPRLKNLLVELDEEGHRKASADPERRLRDVVHALHMRRSKQVRRDEIIRLDDPNLDENKELELLNQILEKNRERQGISAPKDG
jgi:DNA primase